MKIIRGKRFEEGSRRTTKRTIGKSCRKRKKMNIVFKQWYSFQINLPCQVYYSEISELYTSREDDSEGNSGKNLLALIQRIWNRKAMCFLHHPVWCKCERKNEDISELRSSKWSYSISKNNILSSTTSKWGNISRWRKTWVLDWGKTHTHTHPHTHTHMLLSELLQTP